MERGTHGICKCCVKRLSMIRCDDSKSLDDCSSESTDGIFEDSYQYTDADQEITMFASAFAAQIPIEVPDKTHVRFVVDSGATHIFVNSLHGVGELDTSVVKHVRIANGDLMASEGMGMLNGKFPVVFMPSFSSNLCSVSVMADLGYSFNLGIKDCALIKASTGEIVAPVHRVGNSYFVDFPIHKPPISFEWMKACRADLMARSTKAHKIAIKGQQPDERKKEKSAALHLHQIFHVSDQRLQAAINGGHFTGHRLSGDVSESDFGFDCSCCLMTKTRLPDRISQDIQKRSTVPFERIHIDTKSFPEPTWEDHRVALIIVDDCTNACFVYTCHSHDDQIPLLEKFICQGVSGLGYAVKKVARITRAIRSDGAGEFTGREYSDMLTRVRAHGERTVPYTPQQNGRVERKIQTLLKSARALKMSASLPIVAWGELLKAAAYLENLLPTTVNVGNKSPMEIITGKPVDVSWLQPVGTLCTVHRDHRKPSISQLDPNAIPGKLVGFSLHRHLYRICVNMQTGKIVETDKVNFFHRPQALMNLRPEWPALNPQSSGVSPDRVLMGETPSMVVPWIADRSPPSPMPRAAPDPVPPIVPAGPPAGPPIGPPIPPGAAAPVPYPHGGYHAPGGPAHQVPPMVPPPAYVLGGPPPPAPLIVHPHHHGPHGPGMALVPAAVPPVTKTKSGRVVKTPARYDQFRALYVETVEQTCGDMPLHCREAILDTYMDDFEVIMEALAAKIPYHVAEKDPRLVTSMIKELRHLFDSDSVSLVPLPVGRKAIGVTWAHKLKHDENNDPTYAKSRVCPQGFSQIPGVDFDPDEVAAPTVNMISVFLMLCLTVHFGLFSTLYDVDAAFTIPTLKEEVYMKIPQGLERVPGYALKLETSLNGLKQSAYNWNVMAAKFVVSQGFKATVVDPCLYVRRQDGQLALIALYVDDFRTAFKCLDQKTIFEANMEGVFPIKKLSGDHYLGMSVKHDHSEGTITITHAAHISNMLARFNMTDCKPVTTPAAPGTKLRKAGSREPSDPTASPEELEEAAAFIPHYRAAVGALLWIARTTKPEILYAVNQCGAHSNAPDHTHVTAVKRILRYCKGTINEPLILRRGEKIEITCFTDSDFAGEPEESDHPLRSLSGLIVGLKGIGFIHAMSSLQTTVSRSTAEAEYRAGGNACQVIVALRNQLEELGFKQEQPTVIQGDNEACIKMFKSEVSGSALKHIKIDHHFVRAHVKQGEIKLVHTSTQNMVADIMTKALSRILFNQHKDTIRNGGL